MNDNALEHYNQKRKPSDMALGYDAIKYVVNK